MFKSLAGQSARQRGKSCVNSIKTDLFGENYGRNNFYQGGFSTMKIPKELIKEYVKVVP